MTKPICVCTPLDYLCIKMGLESDTYLMENYFKGKIDIIYVSILNHE